MSTGRSDEEDRSRCTPCRGTGVVISAKGGERHELACPWCGGTGSFRAGCDAQAQAPSEQPST